jgi:hypothetical protein
LRINIEIPTKIKRRFKARQAKIENQIDSPARPQLLTSNGCKPLYPGKKEDI